MMMSGADVGRGSGVEGAASAGRFGVSISGAGPAGVANGGCSGAGWLGGVSAGVGGGTVAGGAPPARNSAGLVADVSTTLVLIAIGFIFQTPTAEWRAIV